MKKIIGFLLVILVLIGFFTGCGKEEKEPIPQTVMIDGALYYNTNQAIAVLRCGMMDGCITSTVKEWEYPTEDNQSNFGTGFNYQLVDEHHYDIPMDNPDGWIRFCDGNCDKDHSLNLSDNDDLCGYPKKEDFQYPARTDCYPVTSEE